MQTFDSASVYERLQMERAPYLHRAKECASFTVPSLQPPSDSDVTEMRGQKLNEPWQSFGARAVNNLTSKLALTVLPLNAKFFRLAIDEASLQDLEAVDNSMIEVEEELAKIEDMVLDKIEGSGLRTKVGLALRFVEVSGNALLHIPANRPPRVYRLDSFVIERDPRDNIVRIVIRERVSPLTLDQATRDRIQALGVDLENASRNWVEVFTHLKRDKTNKGVNVWREWQEVKNKILHKVTTHQFDRNPYIHMRGTAIDGEAYGRSHCEEFAGDFRALDALSKGIQQGTAQAAKVIWGVSGPTGLERKLAKTRNGGFVSAKEGEVWPISMQRKAVDFQAVRAEIQDLKHDLGMAFLMNSTVPRQAERVTAEEIRLVASELDDTLGGTFSLLSSDLQLPLVNIILGNMIESGEIDKLPEQVRPIIVTGLDAIGRSHDLQRLDVFVSGIAELLGPAAVAQFVNIPAYLRSRAVALGIDTEQLIKSEEQVAQEQQAQQLQDAVQNLGPQLLQNGPPELAEAAATQMGLAAQQATG